MIKAYKARVSSRVLFSIQRIMGLNKQKIILKTIKFLTGISLASFLLVHIFGLGASEARVGQDLPNLALASSGAEDAGTAEEPPLPEVETAVKPAVKKPALSRPPAVKPEVKQAAVQELSLDGQSPDKVVEAVITAYTSTVDQCDDSPFIAASGRRVYDGMIAANWLPFGTKIKIPSLYGDKIFTVHDRMNKRYGYGRMDIWMDASKAVAQKFGVKRVDVEVYYPDSEVARAR
jgi:3D (Asp-Asp-Asp) domain-containing protein